MEGRHVAYRGNGRRKSERRGHLRCTAGRALHRTRGQASAREAALRLLGGARSGSEASHTDIAKNGPGGSSEMTRRPSLRILGCRASRNAPWLPGVKQRRTTNLWIRMSPDCTRCRGQLSSRTSLRLVGESHPDLNAAAPRGVAVADHLVRPPSGWSVYRDTGRSGGQ